jgi:hypothetical protein
MKYKKQEVKTMEERTREKIEQRRKEALNWIEDEKTYKIGQFKPGYILDGLLLNWDIEEGDILSANKVRKLINRVFDLVLQSDYLTFKKKEPLDYVSFDCYVFEKYIWIFTNKNTTYTLDPGSLFIEKLD